MKRKLTDILQEEWKYRLTKIPGAFLEFWTAWIVELAEIQRAELVHPGADLLVTGLSKQKTPNMPRHENPQMYDFLQHMGDVWEGYMYPFFIYNGLTFAFPRMPEKYRLGAALIAANGIIAATEMGLVKGQKPDYLDIPAGVLGSLIYLGVHYLGKNFTRRLLTNNDKFKDMWKIDNIEKYL